MSFTCAANHVKLSMLAGDPLVSDVGLHLELADPMPQTL